MTAHIVALTDDSHAEDLGSGVPNLNHIIATSMAAPTGLELLLQINEEHSRIFVDRSVASERRLYRARHQTEIAALKCMDGRLHLPVMTQTPLGIIQPWRNIGGKFDLGWFAFQESIGRWVDYAMNQGRRCLVIVTYHYSRGDHHRGCAGFGYDTNAARQSARRLKQQFDRVFGKSAVHTIVVGIETDHESLILHGEEQATELETPLDRQTNMIVDLATVGDVDEKWVHDLIDRLYPSMPDEIKHDFAPLIVGNIAHSLSVQQKQRPVTDVVHREWVIGIGRGFDWLHKINTALLVGPYDPNMASAIATAGTIVMNNIKEGRVSGRVVLMSSAPFRESVGYPPALAAEKAKYHRRFAYDVLRDKVPEIVPYLEHAAVRVDMNTRKLEMLERYEPTEI